MVFLQIDGYEGVAQGSLKDQIIFLKYNTCFVTPATLMFFKDQ
jgi:hypothetical protein